MILWKMELCKAIESTTLVGARKELQNLDMVNGVKLACWSFPEHIPLNFSAYRRNARMLG